MYVRCRVSCLFGFKPLLISSVFFYYFLFMFELFIFELERAVFDHFVHTKMYLENHSNVRILKVIVVLDYLLFCNTNLMFF